jgi:hypothetical protein|tara:strand:- start:18456 stop:19202 length:747 start_codon:yes stop_codon:yes gene_type:complete
MPSCYLQIYENLKDVEDRDYWKEYIDFYEDYWGGPTSPYGVWFGNEYSVFQDSIADHLSLEKKDLKECLFVKDNENYYLCPNGIKKGDAPYSLLVNNVVPIHWFFLFAENQKKVFKTHWGFGAIHYTSNLRSIDKMIKDFTKLRKSVGDEIENLSRFFNTIGDDLTQIIDWSNEFSQESKIILNYGDLLISFPPNTLDKEDSVKIVSDFKYAIKKNQYTEALALVEFLINRWSKIEFANQKDINKSTN